MPVSGPWAAALAVLSQSNGQASDPGEPAPDRVEYLWPDCVEFWEIWMHVQTQWRTGANGATGLDYAGVRVWLDEAEAMPRGDGAGNDSSDERRELWHCIRACEIATLGAWAERREREEQQRDQQREQQQRTRNIPGL